MSGFIVHAFGFSAMLYSISFLCLCYAPLLFFLRNPPARDETKVHLIDEYRFSLILAGFSHCWRMRITIRFRMHAVNHWTTKVATELSLRKSWYASSVRSRTNA